MPRYYFDVWEGGEFRLDSDGDELRDDVAAEQEARRVLAEMGRHYFRDVTATELRLVMRDTFRPILTVSLRIDIEKMQ
jgi:hypothetical protein